MRPLFLALLAALACAPLPERGRDSARLRAPEPGAAVVVAGPRMTARIEADGAVRLVAARAELLLVTRSIARGATRPSEVGAVEHADAGGARVDRGVAVETIAPSRNGVEQAWRFAAEPPGDGDLEVVVHTEGAAPERSGDALVFDAGATRFHYGAATWIDAGGARALLETTLRGDDIVLTVPEAVLAGSRYPAVLDPEVVATEELDPTVLYTAAPHPQFEAAIAGDGTAALTVWHDHRELLFEAFGSALGPAGAPLQPGNIHFAPTGSFDVHLIHLETDATDTRRFVMVWSAQFDLHAVPIEMAPSGDITLLDDVVLYTPPPGFTIGVLATADGPGHYLVVITQGNASGAGAHALLFDDSHGDIAGPVPLVTGLEWPVGFSGAATYAGSSYILLHRPEGDSPLRARVLDATLGTTTLFTVSPQSNDPTEPGIAYNGSGALAIWEDHRAGPHVYAARLDETGVIGAEIQIAGPAGFQFVPAVAAGDAAQDEFVLAWLEDATFEGQLAGGVLHANDTLTSALSSYLARRPVVTSVAGEPLVVFDDGDELPLPDATDVFAARLSGSWPAQATLLSQEANLQQRVAIDSDAAATRALAAWSDTRAGRSQSDIFAIFTDEAGAPVGDLLRISSDPLLEDDVDVAAGDGEWLLVWRRGDDTPSGSAETSIEAALLAADGSVTHTATLAAAGLNLSPRVTHDGGDYLVTWESGTFSCEASICQYYAGEPVLLRVGGSSGSIVVSDSYLAGEPGFAPVVTKDPGGGALWVWEHDGDLHAARVPAGAAPAATLVISAAPGRQTRPAAAMSDGEALVVWEDDRNGGAQLFGALLHADDSVDALVDAVSGDIAAAEPEVVDAGDGYSYLVVWDGSAFGAAEQVWGAFVKKNGVLADPTGVLLTTASLEASRRPDAAPMGPGRALVGFDAVGAERSPRARVLLLDSGLEDGSGCALHADCASRFCADGVCCQTACDAPCQRCSDSGVCGQVVSDSDDLCFGAQICDAEGFCRRADGETCAEGGDCASGFCVDGVCCETACDGQCDKCNEPGTAGQCRQQSCAPYGCLPDKTCRSRCEESRHCVDDFQCVDGSCETPVDLRVVDPGCSCSSPGRAAPAPLGLALLLGALGLRRRGRRGVTARG